MTTPQQQPQVYRFNKEADACLEDLYKSVGAVTPARKLVILQKEVGGDFNFQAFGGELNEEIRLGCLEYEYLERMGKIEIIFA